MAELRMSGKERIRLEAFGRVKHGAATVVLAAELAGLWLRQARRVWQRFKVQGDAGLVHQLRGQPSNHRLPPEVAARVIPVVLTLELGMKAIASSVVLRLLGNVDDSSGGFGPASATRGPSPDPARNLPADRRHHADHPRVRPCAGVGAGG